MKFSTAILMMGLGTGMIMVLVYSLVKLIRLVVG